jgi:diguanylate cyclase (GGDEF)-like protein/PAS domain S-box-containing protein
VEPVAVPPLEKGTCGRPGFPIWLRMRRNLEGQLAAEAGTLLPMPLPAPPPSPEGLDQTDRLRSVIAIQRDVVAADLELDGIMDMICTRTQELIGSGGATILMREGDELVHVAASGFVADLRGRRLGLADTFSGWVYRQGGPAICNDTRALANPLALQRGIRAMLAVPLRHADSPVGLLSVVSQEPDAFAAHDLEVLELLSVVLSAAVSHAAEREARRSETEALARFQTVFDGASIGIVRVDPTGRAIEANPAMERLVGYTVAELGGMPFDGLTHPGDLDHNLLLFRELIDGKRDSYQHEKRYIRKDGETIWVRVTAVLERDEDGRPSSTISMVEDITERKAAEEEMRRQAQLNEHQARHDALTGLPNRALFEDRIEQAVLEVGRDGGRVAVLMMDLDRFKEINDALGHHAGDAVLREVGHRIQGVLRATDTVARLGGDEFGLLLARQGTTDDVVGALERIRRALEQAVQVQDLALSVEGSIGVALCPEDGGDVETLLRRADIAMYAAKERNLPYAFYDEASDARDPSRLTIVGELRRALDRKELVLHYQPKARLESPRVSSVEALVRWNHPTRGLVLPDEFIPFARHTGLIKPLTLYVLEEALGQCAAWRRERLTLAVAVNLPMQSLLDLEFPAQVEALLRRFELDGSALEFEITESTVLSDPIRTRGILDRLSAMGIRLSIDDFGTGYSSLAYLKQLPIDEIKIDRSFVMQMTTDDDQATIVRVTVDLGRSLGLDVVAEGVETEEVWQMLTSLGCTFGQGYHLSRPIPADELAAWLRTQASEAPGA